MKWNNIPFDENASPEEKALEFDLQIAENGGDPDPKPEAYGNWAPYNDDKNRKGDR
jgi:hypothetical protein